MTTHLFSGRPDGKDVIIGSAITLCCKVSALGLPKGDTGAIDPPAADCPALEPRARTAGGPSA